MKLLGGTKTKITKNEIGDNVPHLEMINNLYQQDRRILYTFVLN